MFAKLLRVGGLIALGLALSGHTPGTIGGGSEEVDLQPRMYVQEVNPWTHLEWNDDPANFQFAIVADRTGGHRKGIFEDAVGKLNLLQPEFVMSVGDLIEGYTEDVPLIRDQWEEFQGFADGLEMPFFYVPGNHDLTNLVQVEEWERRFGRPYYHFVYKDVLFLCLDSEDPPPTHMSEEQAAYVKQALEENADVRWTLVFQHKPLWVYAEDTGWAEIEEMLKERKHTVFAGHYHTYTKHDRNNTDYFVLATTGGGSALKGPLFGQFDHVVWVTMTDGGPRVANLMLKGIWDKDVRTAETAKVVDGLLNGAAVAPMPIFTDKKDFKGGTTQLRLTNNADLPMMISGRFWPNGTLVVEPATLKATVPPNSVELIDLALQPQGKKAEVDDIEPLTLSWKVIYDMEKGSPIELNGTARVVVERQFDCVEGKKKIVDGKSNDWKKLPFVCDDPAEILGGGPDSWTGAVDCSFRFGVEYDDEYLYIGVEVEDERSVLDPTKHPWGQDGIEVRLDARPDPIRSNGTGQGEHSDIIFVGMSPAGEVGEMVYYQREAVEKQGVEASCAKTESGFFAEIAVPRAYMDEKQGSAWEAFRLNIAVDDMDEPNGALAQLWWRPDWRKGKSYPGSGTFKKR